MRKLIHLILILIIIHVARGQEKYFSKNALQRHIKVLGSDSLLGRGTGNQGGERASQYIAVQLASMRLEPFGNNNRPM